jgi:ribosomal protein S12 methylthiotransferase accessory factor
MWYEFSPGEPEFARADTIGCAGGMTFEDALRGALLEAIERDAMAIWWDNMVQRPAMIPASFDSPELDFVVDGLRAIGRELFLLDCTTDIGVPTYVAVAPRTDGSEPLVAGAADMSPRVAAYRAASEVGQVWYEARRTSSLSSLVGPWLLSENVSSHAYLSPAEWKDAPRILPGVERTSAAIVERLEAAGLEAYAIDHTRTDVCTRTVRAVVPGLRHIWNRRAPGRLYDVPVKIGWRARPALEAELNPIRCMI